VLTRRTRRQLLAFLMLSLLGTTYVGARYARLDRLVLDTSYEVTARFAQSGGIFTGAEVSYRGVKVGTVSDMRLTRDGVDVVLSIDNSARPIPADTLARVANKSAVGEQYVDLEPRTDAKPYLRDGSMIAQRDTAVPVSTTQILTSADQFVNSVPEDSLRTTVSELGTAFHGTGLDLGGIIDDSDAFLATAADNLDVTTALIKDSNQVLETQVAKGSDLRSFARNLALFSATVAGNDTALRTLIDDGSATVDELRTFLQDNGVDLGELIGKLVTTGEVVVKRLPGIRQVLVLYPYVLASGYTVLAKGSGGYETRSGFILNSVPALCHDGYDPKEQRSPTDGSNRPMDEDARCAEPPTKSNPRGSQDAPRVAPGPVAAGEPVATYDLDSGRLSWGDDVGPANGSSARAEGGPGNDGLVQLLLTPLT
jgi:phospholipid/cholesterol/gamma-HCH transport system substrate-binding protein